MSSGLDLEILKMMLNSGDPEQMKAAAEELASLGVLGEKGELATNQLKLSQALRATPQPGGTYTRNAYVASSPMEHIGAMANKIMGGIGEGIAMKDLKKIQGEKTTGRANFLRKLFGAASTDEERQREEERKRREEALGITQGLYDPDQTLKEMDY